MAAIEKLKKANNGWLYYKRYYREVDFSDTHELPKEQVKKIEKENEGEMQAINATITAFSFTDDLPGSFNKIPQQPNHVYPLITTYPGLLTGSGYTHETGKLGETKIGFFFDHTTGLPCLPGHSVKGALRSWFPQWHNKDINHQKEKQEHILELLKNECKVDIESCFTEYLKKLKIETQFRYEGKLFITLLENIIFEGKAPKVNKEGKWVHDEKGQWQYEPMSIYKRDIFHDAYIMHGGKDNKIFGMDAITPHEHPLKNPKPLAFIKVLPEVYWYFPFHLKNNIISAEAKLLLFITLLQTFGIGAKTNVGYGQFNKKKGYLTMEEYYKAGMPTLWPLKMPDTIRVTGKRTRGKK